MSRMLWKSRMLCRWAGGPYGEAGSAQALDLDFWLSQWAQGRSGIDKRVPEHTA